MSERALGNILGMGAELEHEPVGADDVVAGAPTTATSPLGEVGGAEFGVWEMSTGAARDIEVDEVFVVLSGSGRITFDDGSELELTKGVAAALYAGQRTVWTITEPLRKLYIAPSGAGVPVDLPIEQAASAAEAAAVVLPSEPIADTPVADLDPAAVQPEAPAPPVPAPQAAAVPPASAPAPPMSAPPAPAPEPEPAPEPKPEPTPEPKPAPAPAPVAQTPAPPPAAAAPGGKRAAAPTPAASTSIAASLAAAEAERAEAEAEPGRFAGKVAVVTGAARGIGFATASRLAAEGASVAILDLDESAAVAAAQELPLRPGRAAIGVGCDVADTRSAEAACQRAVTELGGLHILVNNAGITRDNLLFKMTDADWDQVIGVHLRGAFAMTRAAQKHFVEQRFGRVVCLSSTSALGNRGQANYSAAKMGLQGFVRTLAIELGPFGVTANAVAPGFIATEMTDQTAERLGMSVEDFRKAVADANPVKRVGQPEDIAAAITFLCSDEASFVTGQTLYVDGGAKLV